MSRVVLTRDAWAVLRAGPAPLPPDLREAVHALDQPDVAVRVDLTLARGGRLTARHGVSGERVARVIETDRVELAWLPVRQWPGELTALATPPDDLDPSTAVPPGDLMLPLELLLGAGAALREGREAVLAELLRRAEGEVRVSGRAVSVREAEHQVRLAHTAALGRLWATVASRRHRLGLVSWLLYADGWRALGPVPGRDGRHSVRLRPVPPTHLSAVLTSLSAQVRR